MFTTIISAAQLHKLLADQNADVVVFDVRHRLDDTAAGHAMYHAGHIPGALHAHLDSDLSSPVGLRAGGHSGRHPLPDTRIWLERLGKWGIGPQTQVVAYDDQGDLALSQHAYEESLRILESLPDNVREYAMALDDFGGHYLATDQFEIANRLRMKALSLYENIGDHGGVARTSADLAGTAFSQKKVGDGSKFLKRAIKEARLANDLDEDDRAAMASLKGWQAEFGGDLATSIASYRQALELLRARHGEEHPSTGWGYMLLGGACAETGQLTTALEEMRQGVAVLDRTLNHENPKYLGAEMAYSRVLDATGSHSEAARIKAVTEPVLADIHRMQCAGCTVSAAAFH